MTTDVARSRRRAVLAGLFLLVAALPLAGSAGARAEEASGSAAVQGRPIVGSDAKHDTSPPLRELARQAAGIDPAPRWEPNRGRGGSGGGIGGTTIGKAGNGEDPVVQHRPTTSNMPSPIESFEGLSSSDNAALGEGTPIPPDTVGDVGPDHYLQMVNLAMAVFDKDDGTILLGPIATNTIWNGFGTVCENTNQGDPIVVYDELADRWLISQFAFNVDGSGDPIGPYSECVAVSETGDPTGAWHRYRFQMPDSDLLNDYPKLGVWPDAYYMGINEFEDTNFNYVQASLVAFEREEMLVGGPANFVYHTIGGSFFTPMPADVDGPAPPAGAPGVFVELEGEEFGYPNDRLHIFTMDVNWANNTAVVGGPQVLQVATANLNQCAGSRDCIPQPGVPVTAYLDAIDERLMFRAAYRNMGTHEALVLNHTVDALTGAARQAGVRWYELRRATPTANWSIQQQGTYAPNDGVHRWMGSAAMDEDGDIAVGYSVSDGSSTFPGIRYAGRLASDSPGLLAQGETTLISGGGSQTDSFSRWGDYSAMSVDPSDGCTFWYTTEYYSSTSARGWKTRIGSFAFPGCLGVEGPTVSIGDASANEGDDLVFTVTLSDPVGTPVTVDYDTANGTATAGSDYVAESGTVTFVANDTEETITIDGLEDTVFEGNETFFVNLSNPSPNVTINDGQGVGTIIEDDPKPECPGYEGDPRNDVVGTNAAETLTGTALADIICAQGGNDLLQGLGGNDLLLGGGGIDTLIGGAGADDLNGGEGNDGANRSSFDGFGEIGLFGGTGNDLLIGGGGTDDLWGGTGADQLKGEAAWDILFGQDGNDTLLGGVGSDELLGNAGNDTVNGGAGFDWSEYLNETGPVTANLSTGTASGTGIGTDDLISIEVLVGTDKADRLTGNAGGNALFGLNAGDDLFGLAGNDGLYGGNGFDHLNGGPGFDLCLRQGGGGTVTGCEDTTASPAAPGPPAASEGLTTLRAYRAAWRVPGRATG